MGIPTLTPPSHVESSMPHPVPSTAETGISKKAMGIMNSFVNDTFDRMSTVGALTTCGDTAFTNHGSRPHT